LKIIFLGSSDFSVEFLRHLTQSSHPITLVVTNADKEYGRGKKICPNPVKVFAEKSGIDICTIEEIDQGFEDVLRKTAFDIIVIASFGHILPKEFFEIAGQRVINVHPSLLPSYRGPSPIITPLLNGDDITGVTIMKVVEEVDSGNILTQAKIKISPEDNRDSLEEKLIILGKHLLLATLDLLEDNGIAEIAQDKKTATYTRIFQKQDLAIDWDNDATAIINKIRAFSSTPGCFTFFKEKRYKIIKAAISNRQEMFIDKPMASGTVVAADLKNGILVKCGQNEIISILRIQPPGKKIMDARDFLKGNKIELGAIFE
jgi:methionyl-tRNA formyltransferase